MSDAILYIQPTISPLELMGELKKILPNDFREEKRIMALYNSDFSIRLFENNKRTESSTALKFPTGYFNFRYFIEFSPEEDTNEENSVKLLTLIIEHLWSLNIPCVAESDRDDALPHQGGYNKPNLPWPGIS